MSINHPGKIQYFHRQFPLTLAKARMNNNCCSNDKDPVELGKRLAGFAAIDENITENMIVGIGSGSTIAYAVKRLGQRVGEGLKGIVCVPTSFQAKQLIVEHDLTLSDLERHPTLDIAIDGADEVDAQLNLIKGGGGCLTQEKIVASCAKQFVVIADYRKESLDLGQNWKKGVPIEVIPMAWKPITNKIVSRFGGEAILRMAQSKAGPLVTDNGNFIVDWRFEADVLKTECKSWAEVDKQLNSFAGVVETGLFCGMTSKVYFGLQDGTVKTK